MSTSIIHYEVLVQENGRWHVHARYPKDERDRAMTEARNTEAATGHATKVVRDVYFPDAGTNQEQTIYISQSERRVQPRPLADRQIQAAKGIAARRRARERARQRSMFRSRNPLVRVALALGLSLAGASVVTTVLSWAFRNAPGTLGPDYLTNILLMAYLGTFVMTFIGLLWRDGAKRAPARRSVVLHIPTPVIRRSQQALPYRRAVHEAMQRLREIKRKHWQFNA